MNHLIIGVDATNIRRGGGRTHMTELLNAADPVRDGFAEVFVWGSKETLHKFPQHAWLKKKWLPALDGNLIRRTLWQKFSLGKAARSLNCDVLFVPGGSFSTDFRPVVTMNQNILPFEWRELWRYGFSPMTLKLILLRIVQTLSFRRAEGVIFLTDYAKRGVLQVTGPLSGETRVIPHGLNSRFLISDDVLAQREPCVKGEPIRLIYVSTIDQYKHQWNVVDAVATVRMVSGLDLRLDLIGPSYAPALKRLNAAINERDPHREWVHYHGTIDYQNLNSLYERADIGIWASSCETFGLILLEMMGAGIPVVSSDRGPMPEILRDAGMYFDPQKTESLIAALLELLASEERINALAMKAHKNVKAFSWERCAADTFGFLRHVVKIHPQVQCTSTNQLRRK